MAERLFLKGLFTHNVSYSSSYEQITSRGRQMSIAGAKTFLSQQIISDTPPDEACI
jgi:hypothetical protein